MLMAAPFPGPTLSHYAICLQNAAMMCILDRTVVGFLVLSRPFHITAILRHLLYIGVEV